MTVLCLALPSWAEPKLPEIDKTTGFSARVWCEKDGAWQAAMKEEMAAFQFALEKGKPEKQAVRFAEAAANNLFATFTQQKACFHGLARGFNIEVVYSQRLADKLVWYVVKGRVPKTYDRDETILYYMIPKKELDKIIKASY